MRIVVTSASGANGADTRSLSRVERNIPLIREHGGLLSLTRLRKKKIEIPVPGGNDWSHEADEASESGEDPISPKSARVLPRGYPDDALEVAIELALVVDPDLGRHA